MSYDFHNLNWADFEDLVRDLIGKELGVRFEAFAAGPDGGIDGRHAGANKTIVQAKHYVGSSYASLKSQMQKERAAIDRLAPDRYILATSRPLSPSNKAELAAIIGPWLKHESDILTPEDLNALLRKFPEVEKANFKLWLSGAAMLERIVHAAAHTFNQMTQEDITAKLRVYAPNPSLEQANKTLTSEHVVIISGPPGVGKSTLAEILTFTYMADDWELIAIRDLEAGLARIADTKKQVFLFDDFLGRIALDKRALSHKDSDLARFIKRVRGSPNARFILTTRAYIFEEARRVSEHLADRRLDITKYVLDVGVYTRRIRARILYNHLFVSGVSQTHIAELVASGAIARIVDHKHYNPRLIEWMTDAAHVKGIAAKAYPARFIEVLDHPTELWDIAFRTHISSACRHLLLALFFCSQFGAGIDELRAAYNSLHPALCTKYGGSFDPKDYEEALRILEGGFIAIRGTNVQFVNPSLRDYLSGYLRDFDLLCDLARAAASTDWARAVWQHGTSLALSQADRVKFASTFVNVAKQFPVEPTTVYYTLDNVSHMRRAGMSNTDRLELLLAWWFETKDAVFAESSMELARTPVDGLDSWRDGPECAELIAKLRDEDYLEELPTASEMADLLEGHFIEMVQIPMPSDELEKISDAVDTWGHSLDARALNAVEKAIQSEFANVAEAVSDINSESTLDDHAETLKKLGKRASVPAEIVKRAIETIDDRKAQLEEETEESESPAVSPETGRDHDSFDDKQLQDLFAPLLQRE
jgi:energy-coupling factor transporter ATP-binding protein EcfA2